MLYYCYDVDEVVGEMVKKLSAIGNSYGLIIDRPILDLLRIDPETPLEVTTNGEELIIRPIRKGHKARVKDSARRMMKTHHETLKKLAE